MIKKLIFSVLCIFFFGENKAQRSAIAIERLNILYIGVNNPINLVAGDLPIKELELKSKNVWLNGQRGYYTAAVGSPGTATIEVWHKEKLIETLEFLVKRIPDPYVGLQVDKQYAMGGNIPTGLMKTTRNLVVSFDNFYFNVGCQIQSFTYTHTPKNGDPFVVSNIGETFSESILKSLEKAQSGDTICFDDIKGRCPGDDCGRPMTNALVFNLK
jgi:GldM C-terminal domain